MLDSESRDSVEIGRGADEHGSECTPEIEDSHEAPGSAAQGVPSDGKSPHLKPHHVSQETCSRGAIGNRPGISPSIMVDAL